MDFHFRRWVYSVLKQIIPAKINFQVTVKTNIYNSPIYVFNFETVAHYLSDKTNRLQIGR